jgi:hypothetical protein
MYNNGKYSRVTIKKNWDLYANRFNRHSLEINPYFVIFHTKLIAEATIGAAVFMSETGLGVENTYYNDTESLLYMNYSNHPDGVEEGKKLAIEAMEYVFGTENILMIKEDSFGVQLFFKYNRL